jgi:hypothetical protein
MKLDSDHGDTIRLKHDLNRQDGYGQNYLCYYNGYRTHSGRDSETPVESRAKTVFAINHYRWQRRCRGLFELPMTA